MPKAPLILIGDLIFSSRFILVILGHFRQLRSAFLSLAAITIACSAYASDAKGLYSVHGIGSFKCDDIVKIVDLNGQEKGVILAWIDGVVSAVNKLEKDTFDVLASHDPPIYVPTLIFNYCRQHQDQMLDTSVHTVLNVLRPARIKQSAEIVVLKSDQATTTISVATLKAIEKRLIKLSYFKGPAQGKFSDELGKSIGRFQAAKNMPVSSLPDAQTVFKILLEP